MAILGFKDEAVARAEISKLVTSLSVFGAGAAGVSLEAGAIAGIATQVVTIGLGFIPTKKAPNPYNARQKVYSETTYEQDVDRNRREVRREMEMTEPGDYGADIAEYESAEDDFLMATNAVEVDDFSDAFVGGGGYE